MIKPVKTGCMTSPCSNWSSMRPSRDHRPPDRVIGEEFMQLPWSMAMSTTTLPGRANIPGAVARTSTIALTAATLPYLTHVAANHITGAAATNPALAKGLTTLAGHLVNKPVAQAHGIPYQDPVELLPAT
jgi:hypothetical protein